MTETGFDELQTSSEGTTTTTTESIDSPVVSASEFTTTPVAPQATPQQSEVRVEETGTVANVAVEENVRIYSFVLKF